MMGWLTEWLKAIILIILFAAFIDLIVPNKSMQRYVKMVVSLFILLTILNPVLQIFRHDFQWEKLQFPDSPFDSVVPDTSLTEIMKEGEKLKAQNELRSMEIVQQQTEQLMKKQLAEATGLPIQELTVTVQKEDDDVRIQQVSMKIEGQQHPDSKNKSNETDELVEPVFIHIELETDHQSTERTDRTRRHNGAAVRQAEEAIGNWMREHWNLTAEQISVIWLD